MGSAAAKIRHALALVIVLVAAAPAVACLWDRDTLDVEAKGLPNEVAILTGRFERQPPLYYEMRLQRISGEVGQHPNRLTLYDDAGVAADRLHRGDEAVAWMRKKQRAMARGATRDDRYRYHANLGTFLAHRWLRGPNQADLSGLKAAQREIAAAIRINPNAHFGREKYQLAALDWILESRKPRPRRLSETGHEPPQSLSSYLLTVHKVGSNPTSLDAAVRGLSGLVALGDAWESVDIFAALRQLLLYQRKTSVALLAGSRAQELMAAGRRSLNGSVDAEEVSASGGYMLVGGLYSATRRKYVELRAEADAWQKARTDFMLARLKSGRHPDTDASFWDGYRPSPPPDLRPSWSERARISALTPENVLLTCLGLLLLVAACLAVGRIRRRMRRAAIGS